MTVARLDAAAVDAALAGLPGWSRVGDELRASWRFATFPAAVAFTNALAELAEAHRHHPEWRVAYRRVDVATTTHDAGGLSQRDIELARALPALVARHGGEPVDTQSGASGGATWVPPGHFYSPITDAAELRVDAARLWSDQLRELPEVDLRVGEQLQLARQLAAFYGEEQFAERAVPERRYCLDNEFFCYGDAFAYYALLRHLRPQRVIEVGAGWSSAVLLDTDERFLGGATECTFVEPYPERLLSLLRPGDLERVRLLRRRLQDVPLDEFRRLEAGDVLFVDSSHVAKTGSDLLYAVFEVLPALADGVWVHFHDVHGNFEYPREWVEQGRSWNENYLLRAFLMHNRDWAVRLHAPTLALCAAEQLLPLMPRVGQDVGGSLWLQKSSAGSARC